MAFTFESDISYEITPEQVNEFAMNHGCNATLLEEFGPAGGNPVYKFTSTSYDCLEELAFQIYDGDYEFVTTIINEV